jgi:hypothetical protein
MLRVADCIADRVGLAIPQKTEWQRVGDQIDGAMMFARADLRKRVQSWSSRRTAVRCHEGL